MPPDARPLPPLGPDDLRALSQEVIEDAPCGIAICTPSGRILFANHTLRRWSVLGDAETMGALSGLFTTPGRIYLETHVMPMLRLQGFAREISISLQPAADDAPSRPVLLNAVLRPATDTTAARIDCTLFDATERSRYETALREARREAEELAAIVRTSPNPILRVDGEGRVLSWNRGAEAHFGTSAADAAGRPVEDLVTLSDVPGWFAAHAGPQQASFDAAHPGGHEYEVMVTPIGGGAPMPGMTQDYSVVLRDITSRRRAERHLRLVAREMDHRVKNILTVVNVIARQSLKGPDRQEFTNRLAALTRSHEALTRAQSERVDLALLMQITQAEAGGPDRFAYEGPNPPLQPHNFTSLSMVLHELSTNALKHGALSGPGGRVQVAGELDPADPQALTLDWTERGGPPPADPGTGFGNRMIDAIVLGEFRGALDRDFQPEGLHIRLTLRLAPPD